MAENSPPWRIRVSGLGAAVVHYDRVRLASTVPAGGLLSDFPVRELRQASHDFGVEERRYWRLPYKSNISVVCPEDMAALALLSAQEGALGAYACVAVEIAADIHFATIADVERSLHGLAASLSKPRHMRGRLEWVWRRCQTEEERKWLAERGLLDLPTFYFEDRKAGVGLKLYGRREKLPAGRFGGYVLRIEWTLNKRRTIERHLGGSTISDLLRADLPLFVRKHLVLERVDWPALGLLIKPFCPDGRRQLLGNMFARGNAAHDSAKKIAAARVRNKAKRYVAFLESADAWELTLETGRSPAQLRGILRALGKREASRTSRGNGKRRVRPRYSRHRINGCFERIT